jgi:hypothetical protein
MTMKPLFFVVTIVALAQPAVAGAEGRTLIFGNVSGWTVHTNPASDFDCFAEARYDDESSLRIGFSAEGSSLFLRIADRAWAGAGEGRYALDVQFDDQEPLRFTVPGFESDGSLSVSIEEERQEVFLGDFTGSYTLSVRLDESEPIMFSLGGSLNATRMLQECQVSMRGYRRD